MRCSSCGSDNAPGRRFCGECGRPLSVTCPACGNANDPVKFCGACGTLLTAAAGTPPQIAASALVHPESERRLVSVLFADLVGYTSLTETRDPEEAREFLGRYFDTCRTLVSRYGGVVEKFIGDAVVAVWGTPVAQEDDAERAVRTALDLVQAVSALGVEVGLADLKARVGVLTGEAAINLQAEGQGMVAGDVVNTASRIQTAAQPGRVLVGERTRRASEQAIAYEDAGSHQLKGKVEPEHLWRALRVVGWRGGALRGAGLEPPFVGRDSELRTVKDLFHSSAEQHRAHMLSAIGIGGIGKSRLAWEFSKYIDGLSETVWWHRGRCLAYGDGVTYWALADMVRRRAGIAEGEEAATAKVKLTAVVAEFVTDQEERAWIEARLAHLLSLQELEARGPEELFGAWRLFFERMAERGAVIMVFEDMQWADSSLLDFIDYLLNWSRAHPIFVLSLARPEITDRYPQWASGRRGVSMMYLEPLQRRDMEELVDGLVPGLPDNVRTAVLERAEGVPLYAVETVRMLLDRGLLVQEGETYRPTGPLEALEVPESLQGLIASRLDSLPLDERTLLQDAAVFGKTSSVPAIAAISGRDASEVEATLGKLVRKEVLSVQADPRSPDRGQYVFLQDLVRKVAYDTLSRHTRLERHVAAAGYLESQHVGEEQEIAEVVASHYLDAARAASGSSQAEEIRGRAREALIRAGAHAESLAARREALRYFEQSAELASEPKLQSDLLARAGTMAFDAGLAERGRCLFDRAIAIAQERGDDIARARIEVRRAHMSTSDGRLEESLERLSWAYETLAPLQEAGPELAQVASQMGRVEYFLGHSQDALAHIEVALQIAEEHLLYELLSDALNTKGIILGDAGRRQEAEALLRQALSLALQHDLPASALRAYNNLAGGGQPSEIGETLGLVEAGLELSQRFGYVIWQAKFLSARCFELVYLGRWDEALLTVAEIDAEVRDLPIMVSERIPLTLVHAARAEFDRAEEVLAAEVMAASENWQEHASLALGRAYIYFYSSRYREAAESARRAIDASGQKPSWTDATAPAYTVLAEAVVEVGDLKLAGEVLAEMESHAARGRGSMITGATARLRARLAAVNGEQTQAMTLFVKAADVFRSAGIRFEYAVVLAEEGEWLVKTGHTEEGQALLTEARTIFEELRATWWLDRLNRISPAAASGVALVSTSPSRERIETHAS